MPVLFFDIGATLADARMEADGSLRLLPRPRVLAVLDDFRDVRKGVISNPGPGEGAAERAFSALREAFPGRFTDDALVHWGSKDNREIFDEAVAGTAGEGTPPRRPTNASSWAKILRSVGSRGKPDCVPRLTPCSPAPQWRTAPFSGRGSSCRRGKG